MKRLSTTAAVALMALSATAASQPQVKHLLTDTNGTKVLSSQLAPRQEASCKAQFETLKAKQTLRADAQQPRRAAAATGNTDLIQAPEGLETSEFVVTAMSYAAMANITYKAQVGIDGNEMYIKGLFEQLPEAWVKGTIEGDQVTFAPDQYMGKVSIVDQFDGTDLGEWDAWMEYTVDFDSYCAATLTYDAELGVISDEQGGHEFAVTLKSMLDKRILTVDVKIPAGKKDINDLSKEEFEKCIKDAQNSFGIIV